MPCSRQIRWAWFCAEAGGIGGTKATKAPAISTLPSAIAACTRLLVMAGTPGLLPDKRGAEARGCTFGTKLAPLQPQLATVDERRGLVALRQAQDPLGHVAQDELLAHWRDAGDQHLAQEAFHVKLLGIAVAAMGEDRALAGGVGGARAEILGGVCLGAALLSVVIEPGRLEGEQVGSLELHPALGERVLDRLVLADRPAEHDALLGVLRGAGGGCPADADRLGRDQHALRVEPMQQVVEALAFLADAVFEWHF